MASWTRSAGIEGHEASSLRVKVKVGNVLKTVSRPAVKRMQRNVALHCVSLFFPFVCLSVLN